MLRFLWGLATLLLGGCWYSSPISSRGAELRLPGSRVFVPSTSPEVWRRKLTDRTWLYVSTQVYHTSADGRVFLWYPEEPRLFVGDWKLDMEGYSGGQQDTTVCFRYPGTAIHPMRRSARGDEWYCAHAASLLYDVSESVAGDVFGLATRSDAPFVLSRKRTTLAALQARVQRR